MIDEQKLNKKLAGWAGFKWHKTRQYVHGYLMHGGKWEDGHYDYQGKCWYDTPECDGISYHQYNKVPDFTNSLDACDKWLLPRFWICNISKEEAIFWDVHVSIPDYHGPNKHGNGQALNEKLALALCLAIEKLIDG